MMKWDEKADIIVVGSGVAGLCGAIEAADKGASVIVVEKMKNTGGNSRISDGGLAAALKHRAAPVHLSWIQTGPWGCADEKGYGRGGRFASYSVYPCGILVDPSSGRRLVNEWADRKQRSDAILRSGNPCLGIVDSKGARKDPESLKICLKQGKSK